MLVGVHLSIPHSDLGPIFATGNLPDAYRSFETEHDCNEYCRFYRVPGNYSEWSDDNLLGVTVPEVVGSGHREGGSEAEGAEQLSHAGESAVVVVEEVSEGRHMSAEEQLEPSKPRLPQAPAVIRDAYKLRPRDAVARR